MNTTDRYVKSREALEMEVSAMRELPRDLVTILRTEANNQRTPPIDYVIAEDGGRMVHTPEPDIAMAELLEEAAAALAEKDKEIAALREALRGMSCPRPCNHRPDDFEVGECFDAGECGCIAGTGLAYNAGGKDAD